MTRVYVADTIPQERSALRLFLLDLQMEVVGEGADWDTTLINAPLTHLGMILMERDLLPLNEAKQCLAQLRLACSKPIVIIMISHLFSPRQSALEIGADAFICKGDLPERIAGRLLLAAAGDFI